MHLEAQGDDIWDAVEDIPFVHITVVDNISQSKIKTSQTDDDKKQVLYDKKAKNILASALGMDAFFCVSNCKTTEEIWDTLIIGHEGTYEMKRSKLNTISQEYEMFIMEPREKMVDLQK